MKPADQAHVSAVTEDARQSASTIERAARLRDYFALQLHFAEVVAARAALPLADAVAQCTNFYRRFGFGRWHAPIAPAWQEYTASLLTLETHDQRVAWTQAFFAQLPPERLPSGRHVSRDYLIYYYYLNSESEERRASQGVIPIAVLKAESII